MKAARIHVRACFRCGRKTLRDLVLRVETKRLLDRLGQSDFQYREYEGAKSAGVERWPLFELVSRQLRGSRVHSAPGALPEAQAADAADSGNSIQAMLGRIATGRGQ